MDFDRLGQIVDNISTKLAIIQDEQLEKPLNEYIPKLLNLLLVDHDLVRKKLMNALTLIRRRLSANESIRFDFKPFIPLYLSENAFLKNFSKIFLDMAFQRDLKKQDLWEPLLNALETREDPIFYGYLLQCLPFANKSSGTVRHLFPLFQNILLCKETPTLERIPSGVDPLFLNILKNIKIDNALKMNILKFCKDMNLSGNDIYLMLVISSLDEQDEVSSFASDMMKKTFFDWNETLVGKIFDFYQLKPGEKIKLKLIQSLMNTPLSASMPGTKILLNDAFFAESASTKLKTLGLQFFLFFIEKTEIQDVQSIFISIMGNLNGRDSEQFYLALGIFLKKWPKTIDHTIDLFKMYFDALKSRSNKIAIQQGLYAFLSAVTNPGKNEQEFLLELIADRHDSILTSAIYCANQLFPFSNIVARFINLYCIEKSSESSRGVDLEGFCKYRQVEESILNDWPDFEEFVQLVSNVYQDKKFVFGETIRVEILKFLQKCKNQKVTPSLLKWLNGMMTIHASSSLIYEIGTFLIPLLSMENLEMIWTTLMDSLMIHLYTGSDLSRDVVSKLLATIFVISKKDLIELNFESTQDGVQHGTWSFYGYYLYYYYCHFGIFPKYLMDLDALFKSKPVPNAGMITFVGKLIHDTTWRASCITLISDWLSKTEQVSKKEKIIAPLGFVNDSTVLDLLFGLGNTNSEELHFSVGELLCLQFGGNTCTLMPKYFLQIKHQVGLETQLSILKRIVQGANSRIKSIRFSSCVYLLSLLRFCTSPLFEKHMNEIQRCFLVFMSDSNNVIQEIACKGLTQLYSILTPEGKVSLTNHLITTFSGKKETDEMVLFSEKPQLGTNLANYKDLLTVANEIGKPEMIYSFLSYTSSHIILKKTKSLTMDHKISPEMIPKIYRYQYDPNPLISLPIREMWKSLDIKLDPYVPNIMNDLMTHLNSNDHRIRLACCIALMDIFVGKTFVDMSKYLVKLLPLVWRVMDDMKDASRKAALQASERLGAFLIKSCDPSFTMSVQVSLKLIVPILMDGLVFSADIVRAWTLEHLERIISTSGSYIRPYMEQILITLLENMTLLEPSQLNYIQNMIGSEDKQTNETIERLKSEMISNNPIWKCISMCEKYLDNDLVNILIPKMLELLKSSVGTTARQGTAKLLSMMIPLYPGGIKPHVKSILRLIFHLLKQSSVANIEKSTLAKCVPKLIPLGKVSDVKMVISELIDLYKAANPICAYLCQLVVNEVFHLVKAHFDPIIPIIFLARLDEENVKIWNEIWNELSLSVSEYNNVFVKECDLLLEDSNWTVKKRGVKGFLELTSVNQTNVAFLELVQKHLKKAYFPGKEQLLICLSKLDLDQVVYILLEECKKNNLVYKIQALKCLLLLGKRVNVPYLDFVKVEFDKEEIKENLQVRKLLIQLIPYYCDDDLKSYLDWMCTQIKSVTTAEVLEIINCFSSMPKSEMVTKLMMDFENHENTLVKDAVAKVRLYYSSN